MILIYLPACLRKMGSRSHQEKQCASEPDPQNRQLWFLALSPLWLNQYPGSLPAICGISGADKLFIETCLCKANIYLSALSNFAIHLCHYPGCFSYQIVEFSWRKSPEHTSEMCSLPLTFTNLQHRLASPVQLPIMLGNTSQTHFVLGTRRLRLKCLEVSWSNLRLVLWRTSSKPLWK